MPKSAVITGGASGLGEACARRFARDGALVWILDADPTKPVVGGNHETAQRVADAVFLAFAKGLRIHNHLMFLIDGRHTRVTLNRAFAGRHLRRFVVGDITFDFLYLFSPAHPWAGCF